MFNWNCDDVSVIILILFYSSILVQEVDAGPPDSKKNPPPERYRPKIVSEKPLTSNKIKLLIYQSIQCIPDTILKARGLRQTRFSLHLGKGYHSLIRSKVDLT